MIRVDAAFSSQRRTGQSLVELVLCMPVLVLLLMGGYYMGSVIMTAQAASDQIRQSPVQKRMLADKEGGAANGDFTGSGSFDSFSVVYSSGPNASYYDPAILVGTKNISAPLVGNISLTVAAPINRPLVGNNVTNANTRNYNSPLNQGPTCPGNRQYVSHLYRTMLGTTPSKGQVTNGAQTINSTGVDSEIRSLAGTGAFSGLTNRQKVTRLYKAILMRSPDPMYQGYVDALNAGTSTINEVINSIYTSPENNSNISAGRVPPCS